MKNLNTPFYVIMTLFRTTSSFSPLLNTKPTLHKTSSTQQKITTIKSTASLEPQSSSTSPSITTSSAAASKYDWSFLSASYIITCPNADPQSERITDARAILSEVGLLEKTTVKEFETDDEDRIRGCYASHIAVLRDAKETMTRRRLKNGANKRSGGGVGGDDTFLQKLFSSFANGNNNNSGRDSLAGDDANDGDEKDTVVLVLEDNLQLTGNLGRSTLESIKSFSLSDAASAASAASAAASSSQQPCWDIVHLSYTSYVPNFSVKRTSNPNIVQLFSGIGSALGTTAYLISEKGIDAILKEDDQFGYQAPIPDVMAKLFPDSRYAAYPTPFQRAPQTKSLVNPQLDYLRSILFQPFILTKVESLLVFSGLSTNALLPLSVGALLLGACASLKITFDAGYEFVVTGEYTGNVILPVASLIVSVFSLWILAVGAALAPKQPSQEEQKE